MIIVQVFGGLGNQMFQYACGRALAVRTGTQLYLDLSKYYVNNFRQYELDKMNINATPLHLLDELNDTLGLQSIQIIKERQYNFDPNIIALRGNVMLADGYWQTEKYFQDFASVIRAEMTPKFNTLSAESLNMAAEMKEYVSIAIHVRRGDYKRSPLHGILPMGYYEQAMRYFTTRLPAAHFYVFSDDVEWCNREFKVSFPNVHVVEHTLASGSYEDLWLMSQCQHNVIANSTYSWWGAWLNDNPHKIIMAPEPMFAGLQSPDLIPVDWIKTPINR